MASPSPAQHSKADAGAGDRESNYLLVLGPRRGWGAFQLAELWRYRDLLYFLTRREIAVRYSQTVLGFLWAILQPLLTMVVFAVFLGRFAHMPSDGVPYPVFSYLGLLPWTYFSAALTRSSASLVGNTSLLGKVYFPRALIPLSATLSALFDFAIAFLVLIGLLVWYGTRPAASSVLLVPLVLLTALFATGVGMWLAALNARYRDIQHVVPFFVQLWMFATPVVYPSSIVPERWRLLFQLNPMSGIIEAYRSATLGRSLDWPALGVATALVLAVTAVGGWQFLRMEKTLADIL